MKSAQLVAALWQFAVVGTSAASCRDPSIPDGETTSTVTASAPIKQPYFYFPAMQFGYVVVVDPTKFVDHLKIKAADLPRWYGDLLGQVNKDLPLTRNADLFNYVFEDSFQATPIQSLLADLLERGDAAIFSVGAGKVLNEIEMKREESAGVSRRTFLANSNLVFTHVDCVAD